MFQIKFSQAAKSHHTELKTNPAKASILKQVNKSLGFLQTNPRHPSLHTHVYDSISHPWDFTQKVFEAYVQNNSPGAYRIFWCYGPERNQITILAITPHP
jgi:hypothetical protein